MIENIFSNDFRQSERSRCHLKDFSLKIIEDFFFFNSNLVAIYVQKNVHVFHFFKYLLNKFKLKKPNTVIFKEALFFFQVTPTCRASISTIIAEIEIPHKIYTFLY